MQRRWQAVASDPCGRPTRTKHGDRQAGLKSNEARSARALEERPICGATAQKHVLAVPHFDAARLLQSVAPDFAQRLDQLGASAIVNVHVVYDRKVAPHPFAAAVMSPVQWLFDRTEAAGLGEGQYLALSISSANRHVDSGAGELRDIFLPELERLFPAAAEAKVLDFFVTRERAATFLQSPGCGALRPGPATHLPGLYLAGAWTDTGWPATMEGAVRSGQAAAQMALARLRRGQGLPGLGSALNSRGAAR